MTAPSHAVLLAKGWPPDGGGVERYGQQVADAYATAGVRVDVVAPGPRSSGPSGRAAVHPVAGRRQAAVAVFMAATVAWQVVRGVARRSTWLTPGGVVHATTWRTGLVAVALGLHRSRPLIVTVHGREILGLGRTHRALRDVVLRKASVRVAVSPFTAAVARAETGLSFTVALNGTSVPAGVVAERADHRNAGPVRLLSVCRLERRKNLGAVLAAVHRLDGGCDVELVIVGEGPDRAALEAQAQALGVDHLVTFRGFVPDDELWEEYRRADVFVHPQLALDDGVDVEGFGLTIADAMAVGLPVIVGEAGGPGTIVGDSGGGIVIDGRDVEQLTRAIAKLAADADLRLTLGDKAAAFAATQLTWAAHVETIGDALATAGDATTAGSGR
ncbi:MAG: glycosyltransferase family 4 protein [Acidimicrobiales bacterium]